MRRFIRDKNNHLPIKIFFAFLLFDFLFLFIFFFLFSLPPEIPLFYSRPWGESQLAPAVSIWLLPLTLLATGSLNLYLAARFFEEFPFIARVLIWSNVLIAFLTTVSIVKIIILAV